MVETSQLKLIFLEIAKGAQTSQEKLKIEPLLLLTEGGLAEVVQAFGQDASWKWEGRYSQRVHLRRRTRGRPRTH